MKEKLPLVSVIIPTLNRSNMLLNAVRSVENQTYNNIEIIIIDDCSETEVEISSNKVPVTLIRNKSRKGGAASRNIGVTHSKGEFFCFLDDDDVYMPDKILILYQNIKQLKNAAAIFGKVKVANEKYPTSNKHLSDGKRISSVSSIGGLHTNGSLINRELLGDIKFLETLAKYQDTQFHYELIKSRNVYFIDHIVSIWNKEHESPQITDMKTYDQHLKGINSFYLFETHIKKRYKLSILEQWFFAKRKIHLLCLAHNIYGSKYASMQLSLSEKALFMISTLYFKYLK